jgi:hypothetical protein
MFDENVMGIKNFKNLLGSNEFQNQANASCSEPHLLRCDMPKESCTILVHTCRL